MTNQAVTESGNNAVLSWAGTPLFRVLRSDSPDFFYANRLVAQNLTAGAATDVEALAPNSGSHYYLVFEEGEANPVGFTINQPRPVPFLTALTPNAGKAGNSVTIDGGNFNPDGSSMTVTFDGEYANLIAWSATQLTVQVPAKALTGDVMVCWAGVCSNRLPFKMLLGPVFQDVSSIAFEPGTGSLWVADRGSVDTVYEISSAGTLTARGNLNQALLGHPSPSNGNGRIYYSNSLLSEFNFGSIEYIDSATNAEVFFDRAGDSAGTSVPVRCEGIAANNLEPDVAYFLDGRGNTVRRIVRDALAHDLMYGDQPFSFNSPAGARFDAAGNLYLSSTTALYKILPQEAGVELVTGGFTAAAGIDLTEDTGIPLLLVADEATGNVWLVNGETGDKEIVGSGFSGPVGVAFSADLATGDLFYDVAEPTRIVRLPDPRVEFVEGDDVRVLLSKQGTGDTYPNGAQTQNGQIQVKVKVIDQANPAGTTVYFRLIDPKDPSSYRSGHVGDNLPTSPAGSITPSAVAGADGIATATLIVDGQNAGNNYQVEASLQAPPNFKKIARSKTYTSWRRLYIEHDRMYKEGEFIVQTSGAGQPNPARVFVANPATFAVGDAVHILSGTSNATAEGELGIVAALGAGFVDLQSPLALSYSAPQASDAPFPYSFLGKRVGSDWMFDAQPSTADLAKAFDDTFTEWLLLPDGGYLPHWADAGAQPAAFIEPRSSLFFKHHNHNDQAPRPFVNHVQLVSAARYEPSPQPVGSTLGLTSGDNLSGAVAANWTWIFVDTIALLAPSNQQNLRNHVTAHELGHELNVNQGNSLGDGHDSEMAWKPPGVGCLMNVSAPLNTPGTPRFHASTSAPSADLLCIRTHIDDLNQDSCPAFP